MTEQLEPPGSAMVRLMAARGELKALLAQGDVFLGQVDEIAQRHELATDLLLSEVRIDPSCTIDYVVGVVRCR